MSTILAMGHRHSRDPAIMRGGLSALWRRWTSYTLERAIADVARTSDQAYRDFGLDKAELLAALRRLRDETQTGAAPRPLAISLARQKPGATGCAS